MVVNTCNKYSLFIVSVVPVPSPSLVIPSPSPLEICEVERLNSLIVTLSNLTKSTVSFMIVELKISHLDNNFYQT